MAEITKTVTLLLCDKCARSGKERKAVSQATIIVDGQEVTLDLCGNHRGHLIDIWVLDEPRWQPKYPSNRWAEPQLCPICELFTAKSQQQMGQHTRVKHREVSPTLRQLRDKIHSLQIRKNLRPEQEKELAELLAERERVLARARMEWKNKQSDNGMVRFAGDEAHV